MTNNLYVRLEEIEKAISSMEIEAPSTRQNILRKLSEKIKAIPTIGPIEEIDKMIDERIKERIKIQKRDPIRRLGDDICTISIPILQELKSRLSLTQK